MKNSEREKKVRISVHHPRQCREREPLETTYRSADSGLKHTGGRKREGKKGRAGHWKNRQKGDIAMEGEKWREEKKKSNAHNGFLRRKTCRGEGEEKRSIIQKKALDEGEDTP